MPQSAQLDSYLAFVSMFLDFPLSDLTAYFAVCLPSIPLHITALLFWNTAMPLNKALCLIFKNRLLIFLGEWYSISDFVPCEPPKSQVTLRPVQLVFLSQRQILNREEQGSQSKHR